MSEQGILLEVENPLQTPLPSNWKIARLGDDNIASTASGGTPNRSVLEYFGGNIRWVKSGELKDTWIDESEERITQLGLESSSAKIFPAGTLLIAMYGATAGMTGILGTEAAINQAICAIVPQNETLDSRFLQFYLIKNRLKLLNARSGGAQPNVNQRIIKSLTIILPPLPEQRAIARALQTVQDAIQARRKEIELERERKAALMQHLFTHGTRNEPTKQSEIGEIPESWEIVRFGDVCLSSAFGPRFSSIYYSSNGNIATLRTTDIDEDGNINYSTMPMAQLDITQFETHLLQLGDLLVTRSGTCGIAAVFETFEKPVLPGAFLIRFRLSQQIDSYFLRYYMNSSIGKPRVTQLAGGAIQKNLTGTSLRNLSIPLPFLTEQKEIIKVLKVCDSKITALEKELSLHEELFRALLDELMTGRLSALPLVE